MYKLTQKNRRQKMTKTQLQQLKTSFPGDVLEDGSI